MQPNPVLRTIAHIEKPSPKVVWLLRAAEQIRRDNDILEGRAAANNCRPVNK